MSAALQRKLGLRPGQRIYIQNQPSDYPDTLGALPTGIEQVPQLEPDLDVIQSFATRQDQLANHLPLFKQHLASHGMLWICWPKRASTVPTDLTRDVVRQQGLEAGLVDVKICAVDEVWSGLKFVYRLQYRW